MASSLKTPLTKFTPAAIAFLKKVYSRKVGVDVKQVTVAVCQGHVSRQFENDCIITFQITETLYPAPDNNLLNTYGAEACLLITNARRNVGITVQTRLGIFTGDAFSNDPANKIIKHSESETFARSSTETLIIDHEEFMLMQWETTLRLIAESWDAKCEGRRMEYVNYYNPPL